MNAKIQSLLIVMFVVLQISNPLPNQNPVTTQQKNQVALPQPISKTSATNYELYVYPVKSEFTLQENLQESLT